MMNNDSQPNQALLQQFKNRLEANRLPAVIILVGPAQTRLPALTRQFLRLGLCANPGEEACGVCPDCLMNQADQHPDVHWICPEDSSKSLKIEQIRLLQTQAYQRPQRGQRQFMVLTATERMNKSVANALLKTLEEPANDTYFILLAEHLSTMLPTILSRAAVWPVPIRDVVTASNNLLNWIDDLPEDSSRRIFIREAEPVLQGLIELGQGRIHPSTLAKQWQSHALEDILWLLYLIYAQLIQFKLNPKAMQGLGAEALIQLAGLSSLDYFFRQIKEIYAINRKLSHNIYVNANLTLETLLMNRGRS